MLLLDLCKADEGRGDDGGLAEEEVGVGLSLLLDHEVVVEGVHELDVDFLLVEDEALALGLGELTDGLEVVVLLVGDEACDDGDVVAVDAVAY